MRGFSSSDAEAKMKHFDKAIMILNAPIIKNLHVTELVEKHTMIDSYPLCRNREVCSHVLKFTTAAGRLCVIYFSKFYLQ